jgi:hypothetical protein
VTLPGPVITQSATPPPRSAPADVGVWFVVGLTEKGSATGAVEIRSMAEYTRWLGNRVSYGALYDALETFFAEGGARAVVGRVVGPAALAATGNLFDQSGSTTPGDVALVASAKNPGDWGNLLNVEVIAGGGAGEFILIVSHDTLGELQRSPSLADRDAAVLWAQTSDYITISLGASNEDPRVQAPVSLAGGVDDRNNITDAQWLAALNLFGKDRGPGQVSAPAQTASVRHGQLLDHARANNRFAFIDHPDSAVVATLTGSAAFQRIDPDARFAASFAPWAIIPGLTPGTFRTVPYSAVQAGIEARNAGAGHSANEPSAGSLGKARYALGLSQVAWSDTNRELLNEAGVNVAIMLFGGVRTYGYRTLVDPNGVDKEWLPLSNARLAMEIAARAYVIAEDFEFKQIDGAKKTITDYNGALVGMLLPLYGATPDDAFIVDTGDSVNTPTTIQARELRARLGLKMSQFGERVFVDIAKVPLTQALT